jgi:hypothetical protein
MASLLHVTSSCVSVVRISVILHFRLKVLQISHPQSNTLDIPALETSYAISKTAYPVAKHDVLLHKTLTVSIHCAVRNATAATGFM